MIDEAENIAERAAVIADAERALRELPPDEAAALLERLTRFRHDPAAIANGIADAVTAARNFPVAVGRLGSPPYLAPVLAELSIVAGALKSLDTELPSWVGSIVVIGVKIAGIEAQIEADLKRGAN